MFYIRDMRARQGVACLMLVGTAATRLWDWKLISSDQQAGKAQIRLD
jgi:hypothetical protein